MRIFTILLMSVLLLPSALFSQEVSVKEAQNIAKNFFYRNAEFNHSKSYKNLNLALSHVEAEDQNLFYVFEIENQKGFVITSAQGFTRPVLAYSDQNDIDFSNLSPELKFMLDFYKRQIQYGIDNNLRASNKTLSMWQGLRIPKQNKTSVVDGVGPLLLTKWDQAPYFNDMCPTNGSGEHAVVGCVAVAMSQVMKYYNYPPQGSGYHYHSDYYGSVTEASTVYYSQHSYNWNNMPISLNEPNDDLAKLMYHCGHSVNMDWEVDGSGTLSAYIPNALENYFGYSSSVVIASKSNYTNSQWEQLIKNEMDALRPVVFAGHSSASGAGHAWNCDGYQTDDSGENLFHMNYGWGGYGDGYFALNNLSAGSLPGGDPDFFDSNFRIVRNIKPANNYPIHCSEERTITGSEGVFGDGSGNEKYQNNLDCKTLIAPECENGSVTVSFERFNLAEGDVVILYNGENETAPVIDQLDANNPPSGNYVSTAGKMLIRFITDDAEKADGWDISYTSKACGYTQLTEPSGYVHDGSGACDYETGINCLWFIQPEGASQIVLNFSEFNLDQPEHDYLNIYKNTASSSNKIMSLKGTEIPSSITVDASKVVLRFRTYSSENNVGTGWALNYTSDATGIKSIPDEEVDLIKVYPNPFKSNAIVNIENPNNENVTIVLTNAIGQTVAKQVFEQGDSKITFEISDITHRDISQGVYFLNVRVGDRTQVHKLIAE